MTAQEKRRTNDAYKRLVDKAEMKYSISGTKEDQIRLEYLYKKRRGYE